MSVKESLIEFNKQVLSNSPLELEVRFASFSDKNTFERIYTSLTHYGFTKKAEQHTLKCIPENTEIANIRCEINELPNIKSYCDSNILPDNTIFMKKTSIIKGKYNEYAFKTTMSKETPALKHEIDTIYTKWGSIWKNKTYRLMNRITLVHETMVGFRVDMSIVKMKTKVNHFSTSGILEDNEQYEIEIEIDNNTEQIKDIDILEKNMKKTIKYILCGLDDSNFPITIKDKSDVLNEYKSLYGSTKRFASFIGPSSIALQKKNLLISNNPCIKKDFCITDKADGLRKLLYISKSGRMYFITNTFPLQVQYTGRDVKDDYLKETLLDGEYIKYNIEKDLIDLFVAFDVYFIREGDKIKDVRKYPFESNRYKILEKTMVDINKSSRIKYPNSINFDSKKFYFITEKEDLYYNCSLLLSTIKSDGYKYNTDGIILSSSTLGVGMEYAGDTLKNKKYVWKHSFKWKPPEYNTIDFLVKYPLVDGKPITETIYDKYTKSLDNYQLLYLYVGYNESSEKGDPQMTLLTGVIKKQEDTKENSLFIPTNPYDKDAYICYVKIENGKIYSEEGSGKTGRDLIQNNSIIEFKFINEEDKRLRWVPLRVRYDKTNGNAFLTANSNWNTIHNPITEQMLIDKDHVVEYDDLVDADVYYNKVGIISKTTHMREFHNKFVKKKLYKAVCKKGCTIIDYAVGKAGDLHKWLEYKAFFVLGIDISKDNIHNLKDGASVRYLETIKDKKIPTKCVFIEGNTSKLILNNDFAEGNEISKDVVEHLLGKESNKKYAGLPESGIISGGFDVGTIQFAIHYMFETTLSLNTFIRNCSDTIKEGGHLIGTCYDGEKVVDLLKDIETNGLKEIHLKGTKILHIRKNYGNIDKFINLEDPCGFSIGVYQDSINTENNEFLVNFPYFIRLMNEYGFDIIKNDSFETYYKSYKSESKKSLVEEEKQISFLNRAFIFKKNRQINSKMVFDLKTRIEEVTKPTIFISSKPVKIGKHSIDLKSK